MPKCLFCPTEQPQLTDEHVFPAALGGTLVLKNAVCDVCNHGFSEFEQRVASELAPIRFLLQIPDRRGKIPTVPAVFRTATKEYEARVEGKGKLVMKPIVSEVVGDTGKREFVYRFMTARQREQQKQGRRVFKSLRKARVTQKQVRFILAENSRISVPRRAFALLPRSHSLEWRTK
jgi:hypothetical protein